MGIVSSSELEVGSMVCPATIALTEIAARVGSCLRIGSTSLMDCSHCLHCYCSKNSILSPWNTCISSDKSFRSFSLDCGRAGTLYCKEDGSC